MAAHAVREGVRAVAAPAVAERIIKRALHLAGETQIPEGGSRLHRFVERHLVKAAGMVIGEDTAEMMAMTLTQVVSRIPSVVPQASPSRAEAELSRARGDVDVPSDSGVSADLLELADAAQIEDDDDWDGLDLPVPSGHYDSHEISGVIGDYRQRADAEISGVRSEPERSSSSEPSEPEPSRSEFAGGAPLFADALADEGEGSLPLFDELFGDTLVDSAADPFDLDGAFGEVDDIPIDLDEAESGHAEAESGHAEAPDAFQALTQPPTPVTGTATQPPPTTGSATQAPAAGIATPTPPPSPARRPVLLLATAATAREQELDGIVGDGAKVVRCEDVVSLVDHLAHYEARRPVIILDAVHPAVRSATLSVVLGDGGGEPIHVLVWGDGTNGDHPILGESNAVWRSIDVEATADDVWVYLRVLEWV